MAHVPAYAHTFKYVNIEVKKRNSTIHWDQREPVFKVN